MPELWVTITEGKCSIGLVNLHFRVQNEASSSIRSRKALTSCAPMTPKLSPVSIAVISISCFPNLFRLLSSFPPGITVRTRFRSLGMLGYLLKQSRAPYVLQCDYYPPFTMAASANNCPTVLFSELLTIFPSWSARKRY